MANNQNMPHRTYVPILRHDGLEWVATWGQDTSGNPMLVGRGPNPAAALLDYDYKWLGINKE